MNVCMDISGNTIDNPAAGSSQEIGIDVLPGTGTFDVVNLSGTAPFDDADLAATLLANNTLSAGGTVDVFAVNSYNNVVSCPQP